jgi:serine/threonine-protein kinase
MTQIGKYEIVRKTGQTPLGTIYLAFDPVMQRAVSIQSPENTSAVQEPKQRQTAQIALKRGGESLGRLNHPNIRNMLAAEEADGQLYLVLEHVHACPLSERIICGNLSPDEAISLLKMIAAALDHAHAHNVFHPGLTPSCLLVDDSGLLKVAGFEMSGLPVLPEENATAEECKALLKSVAYRAPEFLAGEPPSAHADQFAMAAIAYELLTGRCAFDYSSPLGTMSALLSGTTPDWGSVDSHFPSAVRSVLERSLASEPEQRYSSCTKMVDALETACHWQPASPTRVTPAPPGLAVGPESAKPESEEAEKPQPVPQRFVREKAQTNRRLSWILAAACLVAVAALVFTFLQLRPVHRTEKHSPASAQPATTPQAGAGHAGNIESVVKKVIEDSKRQAGTVGQPAVPAQPEAQRPKKRTAKHNNDLSLPEIKVDH